jgi:uncharacterized protein YneF (UPF0154 family)
LRKRYRKLIDRLVIAFVVIIILAGLVYGLFHMNDYDKKYIAQEAHYEQQISLD